MNEEWVVNIKDECLNQEVPFFFKQWGGTNKKLTRRILEGKTWNDMTYGFITFKKMFIILSLNFSITLNMYLFLTKKVNAFI